MVASAMEKSALNVRFSTDSRAKRSSGRFRVQRQESPGAPSTTSRTRFESASGLRRLTTVPSSLGSVAVNNFRCAGGAYHSGVFEQRERINRDRRMESRTLLTKL